MVLQSLLQTVSLVSGVTEQLILVCRATLVEGVCLGDEFLWRLFVCFGERDT